MWRTWLVVALTLAVSLFGGWAIAHADAPQQRVLVVVYSPLINGETIAQRNNWIDPNILLFGIQLSLNDAGFNYRIVDEQGELNFAPSVGGEFLSTDSYQRICTGSWKSDLCWDLGKLDVQRILQEYQVCQRDIDEVWILQPPFYPEGKEFYITRDCGRTVVVMNFNQERRLAEALESFGHRVEVQIGIGLKMDGPVHRPPLSTYNYQYNGKGCERWGCGEQGYLEWWFGSLTVAQKRAVQYADYAQLIR